MKEFCLWGRIEQLGPDEWLAIASAYAPGDHSVSHVRPATAKTRIDAEVILREILIDVGAELRAAGHMICDVETDGV